MKRPLLNLRQRYLVDETITDDMANTVEVDKKIAFVILTRPFVLNKLIYFNS